jgi:hypothetical protein
MCLAGSPRTLTLHHVIHALFTHLMSGLNATIDILAVFDRADAWSKKQTGWSFGSVNPPTERVQHVLGRLQPRAVTFWEPLSAGVRVGQKLVTNATRCKTTGFIQTEDNLDRALAQVASWTSCLTTVEILEKRQGVPYDLFLRTRPDLLWLGPHPPACSFTSGIAYTRSSFPDQHFIVPRAVAATFSSDMLKAYLRCPSGRLQSRTGWDVTGLTKWIERVAPSRKFPFPAVIVRSNASSESADVLCFDVTQRNPSLNLTTEQCMRRAYPMCPAGGC